LPIAGCTARARGDVRGDGASTIAEEGLRCIAARHEVEFAAEIRSFGADARLAARQAAALIKAVGASLDAARARRSA
jgi:hypothetical protein